MEQWLLDNWKWLLVGFFVLEKIVKASPAKWDDVLFDGAKWFVWRITGKAVNTGK